MELFGCKSFDELIAYNCAPVLVGIKVANLLCMKMTDLEEIDAAIAMYNAQFDKRGLVFRRMCFCSKRALLLVYNKEKLAKILRNKGYRAYLVACGYPAKATMEEDLAILETHLKETAGFPHEIGVFLGYPLEDVLGFVLHKGEKSKYTGYWKVYGDVKKAKNLFACYEHYRDYILKKLSEGMPLELAVSKF